MEELLESGYGPGYLGMSTDGLPFHYLSNDPHTDKRIPTQFASFGELKRLLKVVRERDRVGRPRPFWKIALKAFLYFLLDQRQTVRQDPENLCAVGDGVCAGTRGGQGLSRLCALLNSRLLKGNIHFQALGTKLPHLVRRYCQSAVRGTGVHLRAYRQGVR